MAKRPSLADSLRASLSKGVHVETAERISRGLDPVSDEVSVSPVHVDDVSVDPPVVISPVVSSVVISEPVVSEPVVKAPNAEISDRGIFDRQIANRPTVNYPTVEQSTIPPSNSSPPDISPSYIRPSNRHLYDRQISNHGIDDRGISDGRQDVPFEIKSLPYNQAAVFEFLISAGGIANMRAISNATHVGVPSVKDAVSRLVRRGFMADPVTIRSATFQGFSYVLNSRIADLFIQSGGLEQRVNPSRKTISNGRTPDGRIVDPPTVGQSTTSPSDGQRSDSQPSDRQIAHSSSLESFEKLTTTTQSPTVEPSTVPLSNVPRSNIPPSDSALFVLTGPVAFFWEDEGLQEGQARKWCQDFEVEPVQMRQQLEWARFDIEFNNKRTEILKDAISWFFGVLRKTGGCYPRPANYKSPAEIREESMKLNQEKERAARENIRLLELEEQFQKLLENPQSEVYQQLLAQTNEFEREIGGETLNRVLKEKYLAQNGVQGD